MIYVLVFSFFIFPKRQPDVTASHFLLLLLKDVSELLHSIDRLFSSCYQASYCARSLFFSPIASPSARSLDYSLCAPAKLKASDPIEREWIRATPHPAASLLSRKLTSRLLCLLSGLLAAEEAPATINQSGIKKPRQQLLISTFCALRASRGRRAPVSLGARAEARRRRWRQADEKTPRG